MKISNAATLNISQQNTELISLLIQYHKGELNPKCTNEIENIITNCEECKNLYNEISKFYSYSDVLLFEIQNDSKMNKARNLLRNLNEDFPDDNKMEIYNDEYPNINGGCCCG